MCTSDFLLIISRPVHANVFISLLSYREIGERYDYVCPRLVSTFWVTSSISLSFRVRPAARPGVPSLIIIYKQCGTMPGNFILYVYIHSMLLTYVVLLSEPPLLRFVYHNIYRFVKICDGGTGRPPQTLKEASHFFKKNLRRPEKALRPYKLRFTI